MIRTLVTILVPFSAPFIVYAVWQWAVRRRELAEAEGRAVPEWLDWPWFWLTAVGATLSVITFVVLGAIGLDGSEGTYIPPHYEDGRVVPGRIVE